MRAYVGSDIQARSIQRIVSALTQYAPCEIVAAEQDADLVVLTAIGWPETAEAIARVRERRQRYALVQACCRTTQTPSTAAWLPFWQGATVVWSYLDLRALMRHDGTAGDFAFYHAPLGVDRVFADRGRPSRPYALLTSGYVAETECVYAAAEACRRAEVRMFHLGPPMPRPLGPHVDVGMGMDDEALAHVYSQCGFVAGLRRIEGFELPAAEGLLCGARPVMLEAPHYRRWFGGLAEFVTEGTDAEVAAALVPILRAGPRPVGEAELTVARARFDWASLADGFWERAA